MRVLVTGSSGRIGGAVVARLARRHQVVGLDRVAGPGTTLVGDITDAKVVREAVAGTDAVVHVAALHAPHVGHASEAVFRAVNVDATRRLLDAALAHGHRRFVLTSTTSIYGDALAAAGRAVWVTEALVPRPRDIYDETKLAAEAALAEAASTGLATVSLRMSRCFPEPARDMALYRLYRGVDARDVALAHERVLSADWVGFEVFNISAQTPFTEGDCELLAHDAGAVIRRCHPWAEAAFAARGWALPAVIDRVYVTDKAAGRLGYAPRYNFESLFDPAEAAG